MRCSHSLRVALGLAAVVVLDSQAFADRHALVIGVNDPQIRVGGVRVRPLRGAEYDAEQVSKALADSWGVPGDRITRLLGVDATRPRVEAAMARIAREAKPADTVIFYFAGHGTQVADRAPLDELRTDRLDEALCLRSADDQASPEASLLLDDDIARWLRGLNVAQVSVVLDCCHSGTGIKAGAGDDAGPERRGFPMPGVSRKHAHRGGATSAWADLDRAVPKGSGTRVVALYACEARQSAFERRFPSPDGGSQRMGQFTRFLLEPLREPALADTNADGRLSIEEAAVHVANRIDEDFNGPRRPAGRQTPRFDAVDGGWDLLPSP